MKRFFIIASMAILAIGCQKTEIQNEVKNQIGFSTETGKLTRAIVQNNNAQTADTYSTEQPFAVYAYGHQNSAAADPVMYNVEVSYHEDLNPAAWKATEGSYYWPNDPSTTLDFYAYSPFINTSSVIGSATDSDKLMTVTSITHAEGAGVSFTGYTHENMYVDFMESTPVIGAKYADPDGNANGNNLESGEVPVIFNHKMTQVVFNVTTDKVYPGVTFTVQSIKLKNVRSIASYSNVLNNNETPENTADDYYVSTWSNHAFENLKREYPIFPADSENGAVCVNPKVQNGTTEAPVVLSYAVNATAESDLQEMTTTGATMIPQDMIQATSIEKPREDRYADESNGQMFEIVYSIAGDGVADETVTKHVPFYATDATKTVVNWGVNQRITYVVKIGLFEITFDPSVAVWSEVEGDSYDYLNPDGFADTNGSPIEEPENGSGGAGEGI